MPRTYTVAVIGGGFAGAMVAANLLRLARTPLRVLLFERHHEAGRGVAYGTSLPDHLLNVPAGRMGAWPDQVDHFLRWAEARAGQEGVPARIAPADFLPRPLFGRYVGEVLADAERQAAPGVRLERVAGDVVDLEETDAPARLTLSDGRRYEAQRVVLALGNLPGEYPIRKPLPFYHGPRYVHQPWARGALAGIAPDADVLLVGAGLTAVDMILALRRGGHRGVIHALSRRGLRPLAHKPGAPYPDFLAGEPRPATVRGVVRRLRAEVRAAARAGADWRAVVDAIRPHTQALWQGFPPEEKARFMRHVRPFWEVLRHRIAPQVAAEVEAWAAAGSVRYHAGRLETLEETAEDARAVFRARGSAERRTLRVAKVINCTGPRTDYSKYQHPLLVNLLARGLIDHDPLALGIHALPDGTVLRYRGGPTGWLYTLGAPLKGLLWECTAVPELRVQARALALALLPG